MSQKKKMTAQSKRPRKAPSNQTGGTAWGKKAAAAISGKMQSADMKKLILLNFPYIIAFYMVEKAAWLYRYCNGDTIVDRLMVLFMNFGLAYKSYLPSFHPSDLLIGLIGAAALKAVIYFKGKNAKKYRQGEEYGSARWGNAKDIEPFIDPVFENNVLLTQTERLMMSGRPKHPKYARNKNVIVIGGSGSGKTRFFVKPNLMQMPEKVSYVCTDPKGTIIIECGKMLSDAGYKIKVLNTINFKKSIERFGNLDDAMSQYQALPNHYMKALGVEKNPDPLPGSLDILQCRNGIDTIVEDYKTVPGWDNPYIQNHVVQPLQVALAVQDVELAYELPDAYFHIQTCDDGFDYTL